MGTNQNVITALQIIKDAICGTESPPRDGIKQIVGTTEGALTQQQKDDLANELSAAESNIAKVISETEAPYLDPANAGSGYTPETWTGTTAELISDACEQACEALDNYVACNDDNSGGFLRHTQDALDAFKISGEI